MLAILLIKEEIFISSSICSVFKELVCSRSFNEPGIRSYHVSCFLVKSFFDYLFSNLASRNVILKATSNNISCLKLFSKHLFISILFPTIQQIIRQPPSPRAE
jgi:hypothetical protein